MCKNGKEDGRRPRGQKTSCSINARYDAWKWGGVKDIRSVTPQLVRKVLTEKKQKKTGVRGEMEGFFYGLDLRWVHTVRGWGVGRGG